MKTNCFAISCLMTILLGCKISILKNGYERDNGPSNCMIKNFNKYIKSSDIDSNSKKYYRNMFDPTDDSITMNLLFLSLTNDTSKRPFYVWCLNNVSLNADGALVEYIGEAYRLYVEKFPGEFLFYKKKGCINTNNIWPSLISSARFNHEEYCSDKIACDNFKKEVFKNCMACDSLVLNELSSFVEKCYDPKDLIRHTIPDCLH